MSQTDNDNIDTASPDYQAGFRAGRLIGRTEAFARVRSGLGSLPSELCVENASRPDSPAAPEDISIRNIGLPVGVVNALVRNGTLTLQAAVELNDRDLRDIRGLGTRGKDELDAALERYSYRRQRSL